jgi:hypothetical protein
MRKKRVSPKAANVVAARKLQNLEKIQTFERGFMLAAKHALGYLTFARIVGMIPRQRPTLRRN